jgi:LEA14-like dessication related protein
MMTRIATLALAAVAFVACKTTSTGGKDSGDVSVTVERVLPKAESLDASAIEVTLKLYNPTSSPVKIERIEYEIDTKDVSGVLKGAAPSAATIESSQAAELSFTKSVPLPTQDKQAYQEVIARGTIPADLRGAVLLGDGRKLKFERHGEVATPTLPKFVVYDAQAARYQKEGLDVTIFLRLINENVFPVTVEGVKYTVYVEDKKIKSEQAAIGTKLLQGAAEEFEVTAILDDKTFEKGKVKQVLSHGKLAYRVVGKLDIPELEIPFEYNGEIELGTPE